MLLSVLKKTLYVVNGAQYSTVSTYVETLYYIMDNIICYCQYTYGTIYIYIYIYIYLTAIGLTPGGGSTVHIYTQTIQRTEHT
jgi:hypothetical protein